MNPGTPPPVPSPSGGNSAASRRRDVLVCVLFAVVAGCLAWAGWQAWTWWKSTPPYVDETRFPVRGIDVSGHNGMMNLEAAGKETGISFIILKASEGVTFQDKNFRINYDKATEAGLLTGAYHYFRFDCGGTDQARNFLRTIGDRELPLGLFIDIEDHGNANGVPMSKISSRLTAMVEYLNLLGHRVTVYSNTDGYYKYVEPILPGADLWIASFKSVPPPLPNLFFWQFSHSGRMAGIRGKVDLDAFAGSRAELDAFVENHRFRP
ncbi:MAG: hypothetical protein K2O24_05150 [Muribaculaceae bacterium]|nr:hypothetical protein [Muribaculaceae bacterium]